MRLSIVLLMMKRIKEKSKGINWCIIMLVVVLSYGFLLTNQSIGIDDENFDFYFKNNGIVASGRWGSWLLGKVLNTYSYLPVWRDVIAIVVLIVSALLFLCICETVRDDKLDGTISVIISSIIISYPVIAKMFIYIDNSVETVLCILLATVAAYAVKVSKNLPQKQDYIVALLSLIMGCSIIENTLIYFCVEICLFSFLQIKKDNLVEDIIAPVFICLTALVISKLLGPVIANMVKTYYSDYGMGSYFKWNQIRSIADIKEAVFSMRINFLYWYKKYFSIKLFAVSALFWVGTAIFNLCKKHMLKALYAIGIIVASFSMYIICMTGFLPLRIFTSYFISIAGAIVYIYQLINCLSKEHQREMLKTILGIIYILCVFYQTKESNEYYQLDYKRFLRDQDVARTVNYDLTKIAGVTPDQPVLFFGQPEQYGDIEIESELALVTIYSNNQNGESIRIHRFFSMLGYKYPDVSK